MALLARQGGEYWDVNSGRRVTGLARHVANGFFAHIESRDFSCPMAQGVAADDAATVGVYGAMDSADTIAQIYADLGHWSRGLTDDRNVSFAALFTQSNMADHAAFHSQLWRSLSALRAQEPRDAVCPEGVSEDPTSPDFAVCLHGVAFFIVGLGPHSPRLARRLAYPAVVFNPHRQFERLRETGKMARVQAMSRKRDMALQGSINPLLSDHGVRSAALQYSAHPVESADQCPYHTAMASAVG